MIDEDKIVVFYDVCVLPYSIIVFEVKPFYEPLCYLYKKMCQKNTVWTIQSYMFKIQVIDKLMLNQ